MSTRTLKAAEKKLRAHGLAKPDAYEEFPWGERALKVAKKMFAIMSCDAEHGLGLTVKLGALSDEALMLPFAAPTGYGLGKSGWVTARFEHGDEPPLGILCDWIDESYALVAPKQRANRTSPGPR
ncbi:MAG: MmcQ/YjbR family DNA-binding protein [Candidatus Eremiobacteraeota bacterium]|nr:MmcQ/YjbR family DNA-binding protein [Candidatus Eremiobacteraeota bacterium]